LGPAAEGRKDLRAGRRIFRLRRSVRIDGGGECDGECECDGDGDGERECECECGHGEGAGREGAWRGGYRPGWGGRGGRAR